MNFAGTRKVRWAGHAALLLRRGWFAVCALLATAPIAHALDVKEIRYWSLGEITRVVVQFDGEFQYKWARLSNPPRVFFDLPGAQLRIDPRQSPGKVRSVEVGDSILNRIRYAENSPTNARVVLDLAADSDVKASQLANPPRLIIELRSKGRSPAPIEVSRTGSVGGERTDARSAASAGDEFSRTDTGTAGREAPTAGNATAVAARLPRRDAGIGSDTASEPDGGREPTSVESRPAPVAKPETRIATERAAVAPPKDPARPVANETAPTIPASKVESRTVGAAVETARAVETSVVAEAATPEVPLAKPAARTATGQQSLVRALGLKLGKIVIDPGHGGKDQGTSAGKDLHEKDLVLDIAKRLRDLISEKLGADVVLTREEDVFISLEERTAFANQHRADLFVSLHANSSPFKLASGSETFYLNFTSSREAMDTAARENASSTRSIADLQDIVKKIALKDKRDESQDLAAKVQAALYKAQRREGTAKKNRGVKAAPFIVLIGADMPSILVEIGFLSNAKERTALGTAEYRQSVAEALFQGLQSYVGSLSHFEARERASARE